MLVEKVIFLNGLQYSKASNSKRKGIAEANLLSCLEHVSSIYPVETFLTNPKTSFLKHWHQPSHEPLTADISTCDFYPLILKPFPHAPFIYLKQTFVSSKIKMSLMFTSTCINFTTKNPLSSDFFLTEN